MWLALAIDPQILGTLYAATTKGVFKSTDGNSTWALAGGDTSYASSVVVDPRNPSTVYASGIGMRKSTDGGNTWTAINTGINPGFSIYMLAIDPVTTSTLYAATVAGVYRSTNAGASWSQINSGLRIPVFGVDTLAVAASNPAVLYAAASTSGLYRSTDSGAHWTRMPIESAKVTPAAVTCGVSFGLASCGNR